MPKLDKVTSIKELSKAMDRLPSGIALGKDCIPAEVIKNGKSSLLVPLHKLLTQCWKEGSVSQNMRDANIITLKGDCSDCNNYHSISLLSIIGKLFMCIILDRLQILVDRIYLESQCSFCSKRSTVDMIFSLCQQEKCREQNQPLYCTFIDLTKAFDLVSRDIQDATTNWLSFKTS